MKRVELYEQIRKTSREEGLGVRALAARFGVHRRTVREALVSPTPPARKVAVRSSPAMGPWEGLVRKWLAEDRSAPRKQRHTAHREWRRLVDEHGAGVAESTVRAFVARSGDRSSRARGRPGSGSPIRTDLRSVRTRCRPSRRWFDLRDRRSGKVTL